MQAFVIGIDRDADDRAATAARLRAKGLDQVEEIHGVDGRQLDDWTSYLSPRQQYYSNIAKVRPSHWDFGPSGQGHLGCMLSHRMVWQAIVDRNLPVAAVFESDAEPTADFQAGLALADTLPWEVFLLGWRGQIPWDALAPARAGGGRVRTAPFMFFGTHAYLITRAGAEKLLAATDPIDMLVDDLISVYWMTGHLQCAALTTPVVNNDIAHGSITFTWAIPQSTQLRVWQVATGITLFLALIFVALFIWASRKNRSALE